MKFKDYYKLLEINFGADILAIRKAYRRLALKFHPDRNKAPDASQNFIEITEAYEVLINPNKKREYDKIYETHYIKKMKMEAGNPFEIKQREWADYGKEKAKEYASVRFDVFTRMILKEIDIGIRYIPALIGVLITLFFGIVFIALAFYSADMNSFSKVLMFLFSIGLFYASYRLFINSQLEYEKERKRKILVKK